MRRLCRVGIAVACAGLASCGSGPTPVRVWGEVDLDGKPLTGGQVRFEPAGGHAGQAREVEAADGAFEVPAAEGLLPGEYVVKVKAYRPTGKKRPNPYRSDSPPIDVLEQYVPEVYGGDKSPLRVTVTPSRTENHFSLSLVRTATPKPLK